MEIPSCQRQQLKKMTPRSRTSVQVNLIQSYVQISQKDSEDIVQVQLSSGPREFQTKTGQLVVQQVDHLEKADLDKFESKIKVG